MKEKGTAHHYHRSRGSLGVSGIDQEALALPLASTDQLVVVPDAVAARPSTHAEEQSSEMTVETRQRRARHRVHRHHRHSPRYFELRRIVLMLSTLVVLIVTSLSTCKFS